MVAHPDPEPSGVAPVAWSDWRGDPSAVLAGAVRALQGEDRPGQRALADAVAAAITAGHHLVAEAPTGSGKSLAYLAPAVASGLRVVVSTATIALQDQLVDKDLPHLARHGGVDFTWAQLKGRANYVCLAKLKAADDPTALFELRPGATFDDDLAAVRAFARSSSTGDRAELEAEVPDSSWAAFSCTGQECPGARDCADGPECFAERARRAADVDVLVVNHALHCVDLETGGNVLGARDVVIVDEAHAYPEQATRAFGAELAPSGIGRLAQMLDRAGAARSVTDPLRSSADALAVALAEHTGRRLVAGSVPSLAGTLSGIAERLAQARTSLGSPDDAEVKRVAQLASSRVETVRRMAEAGDDAVLWAEGDGARVRLRLAPVDVGGPLAARLLERRPTVFVSATLGGAAPYAAFAAQVGLDPARPPGSWGVLPGDEDADEDVERATGRGYVPLEVDSAFSWREQGLLYVDRALPDPARDRDAWLAQAAARLERLIGAAGGRALVLCTSLANVRHFAGVLRERTDHRVLEQGEASVAQLARTFVEDESSVLVGTRSFWAGLDVPGTACVLVVIDRIPFPVPTDPLHSARRARAEAAGDDAFATVDVPAAALVLAQGAGRLLRRASDRGVVAVLDPRLATRSYRRGLLAAMPPLRRTVDLEDACGFLAAAAGVPSAPGAEPGRLSPEAGSADERVGASSSAGVARDSEERR